MKVTTVGYYCKSKNIALTYNRVKKEWRCHAPNRPAEVIPARVAVIYLRNRSGLVHGRPRWTAIDLPGLPLHDPARQGVEL